MNELSCPTAQWLLTQTARGALHGAPGKRSTATISIFDFIRCFSGFSVPRPRLNHPGSGPSPTCLPQSAPSGLGTFPWLFPTSLWGQVCRTEATHTSGSVNTALLQIPLHYGVFEDHPAPLQLISSLPKEGWGMPI